MMRLVFFMTTLICVPLPALVWAYLSIVQNTVLDFPNGAIALFTLLFGSGVFGKVIQKFGEK